MIFATALPAAKKLLPATLAVIAASFILTQTATPAQAVNGPFYSATLSRPMDGVEKIIQKGVLWTCSAAECTAARDTSRPAIVCARLAQKVGPVIRFSNPQGDLSAQDLARCNELAAK